MKISIVIPAYNEEGYIGSCLESIMLQEEPADEVILVNNNSTDNTLKVAKKFPIRILNEKKKGVTNARNKGFNAAQYDIIGRTDADSILPPDWTKKVKKSFQAKTLVGLSGPAHFYRLPDVVQPSNWPTNAVFDSFKQILRHDCMYGPNMAVRKSAWEKIKDEVCLDDKEVHEDIDLAIHLASVGRIKFDKNLVVESSFRRWRHVEPYFDYPLRSLKLIRKHKEWVLETKGKQLMRKVIEKANQPITFR